MRAILKQFLGLLAVYVIALQAVLGVWAGAAYAGVSVDPQAILCRTAPDSPATPDTAPNSHRVDCVCASACPHMSMATLVEAAPLPLSPSVAIAVRSPVLVDAERPAAWQGFAQARAPPIDV